MTNDTNERIIPRDTSWDWRVTSLNGPHVFVTGAGGELIAGVFFGNEAVARQIVACVNACTGITNAELEAGVIADMLDICRKVLDINNSATDVMDLDDQFSEIVPLAHEIIHPVNNSVKN